MWATDRLPSAREWRDDLIALAASVLLHGLLLALLVRHWGAAERPPEAIVPRFVEAELLQREPPAQPPAPPAAKREPKPQAQAPSPELERRRAEEEARRRELERRRAEEEARRRELERRRAEEEARRRELERRRAEEEARRRELERRRAEEEARRRELEAALAREEAQRAEAERAALVGTYVDYMASLIAANWSRPPSATRDMEVVLKITLGAAGRVTAVAVVQSSGNAAFDQSAERAVWQVGQFSRLKELDPAVYQREFRTVYLRFRPLDLRK
ncbi:MAG: hypothetical protein KatS3mg124_0280 [Porticoccaceae bacterium]|nr:MAG: hypothetical protein KatS3mg124_0280 [Porticoccaceae bacterium]